MKLCEQAEMFRQLLAMGLVAAAEVVEWADALIAAEEHLPGWLLDVSLAVNEDNAAMEDRLSAVPCDGDRQNAAYAALERFAEAFQAGRIDARIAARMLARWAAVAALDPRDWQEAMLPTWIDDEIEFGNASEEGVARSVMDCIAHLLRRSG